MKTKLCNKCKQQKFITMFYKDNSRKGKLSLYCKVCAKLKVKKYRETVNGRQSSRKANNKYRQTKKGKIARQRHLKTNKCKLTAREYKLKQNFGLTLQDYDKLLEQQNGVCAICNEIEYTDRRLAVDHNHKTGEIRGLLCRRCNTLLAGIDDNEFIRKARKYLKIYS